MTQKGRVEYLNEKKGYGFIKVDGHEKNLFFHAKDCRMIRFEQLRVSDTVLIGSIKENEQGKIACDITLVN